MLIWRTLQFCRCARPSIEVVPAMISSSQWPPRAIARIRPARRSARIGRMRPEDDAEAGSITSRNLHAGGLIQLMVMISTAGVLTDISRHRSAVLGQEPPTNSHEPVPLQPGPQ